VILWTAKGDAKQRRPVQDGPRGQETQDDHASMAANTSSDTSKLA
jgi:hypothetical protein